MRDHGEMGAGINGSLCVFSQIEYRKERSFTDCGERHNPRSSARPRPAKREEPAQECGAKRSRQVMAAHVPVETCQAQRPLSSRQRGDVDSHLAAEVLALRGQCHVLPRDAQKTPLPETVVDAYAQLPGEVIVTDTRLSERRSARPRIDL